MSTKLCPTLIELVEKLQPATVLMTVDAESPEPTIVYVNPTFCRQTGFTFDELVGHGPGILQGSKTDPATVEGFCQSLERGEDFSGETWNLRKDGRQYRAEWSIRQLHDHDGGVTHLFATVEDVTGREALLDSIVGPTPVSFAGLSVAGFTQLLVQEGKTCRVRIRHQSSVGTLDFDQGHLVDAAVKDLSGNQAALEILGWSRAEMTLEPLIEAPLGQIRDSLEYLLLEAARQQDEAARGPQADAPSPWDDGDVLGEWVATRRLHEVFAPARRAGACGVAFIDTQRGTVLSSVGFLDCPNLEGMVATNSQFVRRETRFLEMLRIEEQFEDIIITHNRHWHVLRPIAGTRSLFLFAVFQKTETMLPLARHGLEEAEKILLGPVPEKESAEVPAPPLAVSA